MTISAGLRRMVANRIARFGDGLAVVLRDRSTLSQRGLGKATNTLVVLQPVATDPEAAFFSILAGGEQLIGGLPAGAVVTVGGNEYVLASPSQANAASSTIDLSLAGPIVADINVDDELQVTQPYADTTYQAMRSKAVDKNEADGIPDTARTYRLVALNQGRRPKKGDVLIDEDANVSELVTDVDGAEPGASAVYWTVTCGSAG